MDEQISLAFLATNKTVTLYAVKPLHCSFFHSPHFPCFDFALRSIAETGHFAFLDELSSRVPELCTDVPKPSDLRTVASIMTCVAPPRHFYLCRNHVVRNRMRALSCDPVKGGSCPAKAEPPGHLPERWDHTPEGTPEGYPGRLYQFLNRALSNPYNGSFKFRILAGLIEGFGVGAPLSTPRESPRLG
jgi:hypothetical protein